MSKQKNYAAYWIAQIEHRTVPIERCVPHPRNPRQHPPDQISDLRASYRRFGQFRSLVGIENAHTQGNVWIAAGCGTLAAMNEEHAPMVDIGFLPPETPPDIVEGIMVADNNLSNKASDDDALLAQLIQEQKNAGFDLASLGSDDEALRQMLESLGDSYLGSDGEQEEGDGEEDALPEQIETRCKLGQVWQLGKHRFICADAFDPITYKILLDGVQPHAIITDPPYGMRLDADYSGMVNKLRFVQDKGVKSGRKYKNVEGDHEDFNASAIANYFPNVQEQFWFGADYYSSTLDDTMHSGAWLVWDKRLDESADKMFGSCFELIWSKQKHKRDILRHKWAGIFGTEHEPQRGRQHPTQKPVRLLEDIITRYTDEGQIILDSFLGSGTTLISAERTGRICYGCELSPAYCDVVISRWEKETNQQAQLLERVEVPAHA